MPKKIIFREVARKTNLLRTLLKQSVGLTLGMRLESVFCVRMRFGIVCGLKHIRQVSY